MNIQYLTLKDFEYICDEVLKFFKNNQDPPPNYKSSYFDKLDSVIAIPRKTFFFTDLYPTLFDKTACYLYFINKLHPFDNGNKRTSIVATGTFLKLNGYELTLSEDLMYKFAISVTISKRDQREYLKSIAAFIKINSKKKGQKFVL